ncbi:MAG TPA: maltotransferase domain-containing protein, partial [Acidimicrobiia bacterium]|nr:maltotransferase domain-containing protein [Acidimicrobiia bacterium]
MTDLIATDKRVVIEAVSPEIEGGRFPAKTPLGDAVVVEAVIFADGHDILSSVLRYQKKSSRIWAETPMEPVGNDRWRASFTPDELGLWHFEIEAWVDHFATWIDALGKKIAAGIDVSVELEIGTDLYNQASARARGADAGRLSGIASQIVGESSVEERIEIAEESVELARSYPDRSRSVRSSIRWPVVVDPELATFSSWYELFPRSWSKKQGEHGTFSDVEDRLDYVGDMGFDVLYLPPIHPIGETHRKGRNNTIEARNGDPGVPWAIGSADGGHADINPLLGTIE